MRTFFLSFALVLTAACSRQTLTGVSVDSSLRKYIPPDTRVLAGIDLKRLQTTPFYERHAQLINFPQLNELSERVGIDPRRDVSDLLIAWNGTDSFALLRGVFASKDIEQKAASVGASRTTYDGFALLTQGAGSAAFISDRLVLAGKPDTVKSAIRREQNGSGAIPDELKQQLASLRRADQIWLVSRGGVPLAQLPTRSDVNSFLENFVGAVSRIGIGVTVDTGASLRGEIVCSSEAGARRVHDGLRGGIGFARLSTKDNQQDLLRLYDAIHVDQSGDVVRLSADLPADLADKLLAYLPEVKRGADVLKSR